MAQPSQAWAHWSSSSRPRTPERFGPPIAGQFLAGPGGALALVLCQPPPDVACRFVALFVPALGEEMNKSRRMVALQARALARQGGIVALLDPRGTGDSSGEHGESTWDHWCADVTFAWEWLGRRAPVAQVLWGMRLGGLLATQLVASGAIAPTVLTLWQPALSGKGFFNQMLRMATAQRMLGAGDGDWDSNTLRASLSAGVPIEVGGYELHPELVTTAETIEMSTLFPKSCHVIWREMTLSDPPTISPAASKVALRWKESGADVDCAAVVGPAFWATQEIAEAPHLIDSTTNSIAAFFARRDENAP